MTRAPVTLPSIEVDHDTGFHYLVMPDEQFRRDTYPVSDALLNEIVAALNEKTELLNAVQRFSTSLAEEMQRPHLDKATTAMLRGVLYARALGRLPWNKRKTVHPHNGHGTWLPVYWTWSRFDGDPLQRLGKPRWMKEIDYPYRRGVGYAVKFGHVMLEVGVCRRKNLEPDPTQYGDYDDPGAVDALGARVLDDDIAAISTQYRGTNVAVQAEADS